MKIYLLRHAESVSNANGKLASSDDEQLTEKGLLQAKAIVSDLKELGISKVLCSTYLRARQTVDPFLEGVSVEVEYTQLLTEGELVLGSRPIDFSNESRSETSKRFLKRASKAVELIKTQEQSSLLVVTHGHMIRELINLFFDLPNTVRFPQENCGLSSIELGDTLKVAYLNRRLCSNNHRLGTRSSPQP